MSEGGQENPLVRNPESRHWVSALGKIVKEGLVS